jgi:hypothetical protein
MFGTMTSATDAANASHADSGRAEIRPKRPYAYAKVTANNPPNAAP